MIFKAKKIRDLKPGDFFYFAKNTNECYMFLSFNNYSSSIVKMKDGAIFNKELNSDTSVLIPVSREIKIVER